MEKLGRTTIIYALLALALLYNYHSRGMLDWQEFYNDGPRRIHFRNQFLSAYQDTGHMLLFKPPGAEYLAAEELADDPGIYIAYVWVNELGLTKNRLHNFWILCTLPILGYFLATVPLGLGRPNKVPYWIALGAAAYVGLTSMDVYIFVFFSAGLYVALLASKDKADKPWYPALALLFAVVCPLSELIRLKTGLVLFVCMLVYLLIQGRRWILVLVMIVLYVGTLQLYDYQMGEWKKGRNQWLSQHFNRPVSDWEEDKVFVHLMWHNIYLGLSYDDIDGIVYHDTFALAKAKKKITGRPVKGGFYQVDQAYDEIIKGIYFETLRQYPISSFICYLKKLIMVVAFTALFSGLLFEKKAVLKRFQPGHSDFPENVALLLPCMIFMAPGVLVIPLPLFTVGSVALAPGFFLLRGRDNEERPSA